MFTAIIALFGSLFTGINGAATGQYAQQRAEYEQSLQYSQAKELTYYNTYAASSKGILTIAAIGFIFLIVITYLMLR